MWVKFEEFTAVHKLTTLMHNTTCTRNHTDECGWNYEIKRDEDGESHNWSFPCHEAWLSTAMRALNTSDSYLKNVNREIEFASSRIKSLQAIKQLIEEIVKNG